MCFTKVSGLRVERNQQKTRSISNKLRNTRLGLPDKQTFFIARDIEWRLTVRSHLIKSLCFNSELLEGKTDIWSDSLTVGGAGEKEHLKDPAGL